MPLVESFTNSTGVRGPWTLVYNNSVFRNFICFLRRLHCPCEGVPAQAWVCICDAVLLKRVYTHITFVFSPTEEAGPSIVIEYLLHGDLKSFLEVRCNNLLAGTNLCEY